jgi:predicted N-acyltransferase
MHSIELLKSITEVDRSDWDQLTGHNIFASYGWLRVVEETLIIPQHHCYLVLRDAAGLAAAVPCYLQEKRDSLVNLDYLLFGRLAPAASILGISVLPVLICGTRVGVGEGVFVRKQASAPERARLIALVVEATEKLARRNGWTVCFRGVAQTLPKTSYVLQDYQYLRTREQPMTYLDIEWTSFRDYLRHLKKIHPSTAKSIRREINLSRRGGIVIKELEDPIRYQKRLHLLLDSHFIRLNQRPFPFCANFFKSLKKHLDDKATVYVATHGEQLIGATVALRNNGLAYLPFIGVNREQYRDVVRESAVYFNVAFNTPIRDFIEAGYRRIYYGKMLYGMKVRRGCRLVNPDLYFRGRNRLHELALRPLFGYHRRRIHNIVLSIPRHQKT